MKIDKTDVSAMMQVVEMLRDLGYAVSVISPEDLDGADPRQAEEWMTGFLCDYAGELDRPEENDND